MKNWVKLGNRAHVYGLIIAAVVILGGIIGFQLMTRQKAIVTVSPEEVLSTSEENSNRTETPLRQSAEADDQNREAEPKIQTTYQQPAIQPEDTDGVTIENGIRIERNKGTITYDNQNYSAKKTEDLKKVSTSVFVAVADTQQPVSPPIVPTEGGEHYQLLIEIDGELKGLEVEELSLTSSAEFVGEVVQTGEGQYAVVEGVFKPDTTMQTAAIPAPKNHVMNVLRISDGGVATSIVSATQATNIASAAASYWRNNSNGAIANFPVGTVKSVSKSNICTMTDDAIFNFLASQFGYSNYSSFMRQTSSTVTTLVVMIPGSCPKAYAGLAVIGDGINSNGVIIQRSTTGGIATDSSNNSTINTTFVDQIGSYNVRSLIHEVGHTFGLGHSGSVNAARGWVAYEDFYSPMGGGYQTYTVPKLDGYYRDWLGLSDNTNKEKVGILLSDVDKIATNYTIRPINSTTVSGRYLKVLNPTNGMVYYIDYRSGNGDDARAFYAENSYMHLFSGTRFCGTPGITISAEATRYTGTAAGSMGAAVGRPNIARISSDTLQNYSSLVTDKCYPSYAKSSFQIAGNFALYVYSMNATSGISVKVKPLNNPFSDIGGSIFANNVIWLYQNGIAAGNSSYNLHGLVTRGQMAAFMYRLAGKPAFTPTASELKYYNDVNGDVFQNPILWLARTGITDTRGTYGIGNAVTRGQMAAFMYRLAGSPSFTPTASELKYYSDVNGTIFQNAILWMARNGVTDTRGLYGINEPVTRGQMAAFMNRLNNNVTKYSYY